jgi:hypothetical protein
VEVLVEHLEVLTLDLLVATSTLLAEHLLEVYGTVDLILVDMESIVSHGMAVKGTLEAFLMVALVKGSEHLMLDGLAALNALHSELSVVAGVADGLVVLYVEKVGADRL